MHEQALSKAAGNEQKLAYSADLAHSIHGLSAKGVVIHGKKIQDGRFVSADTIHRCLGVLCYPSVCSIRR